MTYFTHTLSPSYRCTGCGAHLAALQRATVWRKGVPTPVCARAENLTILEAK